MKKTIKTDKLITIMTEFEREQGEAWRFSEQREDSLSKIAWNHYASGIGHCLRELEELLK